MKRVYLLFIIALASHTLQAQNFVDAFRYTQVFPAATARSLSMGNAFVSLGGDMATGLINPAGFGVYRKSELTISPGFNRVSDKSTYYDQTADDFSYRFHLNNFGYVANYNNDKTEGFASSSFAITYNRVADFNNQLLIKGINDFSSLAHNFILNTDRVNTAPANLHPFSEGLAYDGGIIFLDSIMDGHHYYWTPVLLPVTQTRTINTRGGINEWTFAFGSNLSHRFYFGASLGIENLRYTQDFEHEEEDFILNQELGVTGTGYTLRLGIIARPLDFLRLGATYHLPTFYSLTERYYATLKSVFVTGTILPQDGNGNTIERAENRYALMTPGKAIIGAALMSEFALLSIDAEYLTYNNMRLRQGGGDYSFATENADIRQIFKPIINLRTGLEVRAGNVAMRGGYGYYPNPFKAGITPETAVHHSFSAGMGIRDKDFFLDFGLRYNLKYETYNMYDDDLEGIVYANTADITQGRLHFITTLGLRF